MVAAVQELQRAELAAAREFAAAQDALRVAEERRAAVVAAADEAVTVARQEHAAALAVLGAALGEERAASAAGVAAHVVRAARKSADSAVVRERVQALRARPRRERRARAEAVVEQEPRLDGASVGAEALGAAEPTRVP